MLTFNKDLVFSNGFSAASGCAPTPYPIAAWDGTLYDWFDGMYDDQIDPVSGKKYDKKELENAVFDGKLEGISVNWYDNSWGYGNSTSTDVNLSFHHDFQEESVTWKQLLIVIHEGFSKTVRESEARIITDENRRNEGPPETAMERAKLIVRYTGKTRYQIWHPDEVPFIGPMRNKNEKGGYFVVNTYR